MHLARALSLSFVVAALSVLCTLVHAQQPRQRNKDKAARDPAPRWVWNDPQTPAGTQHKTFKSAALNGQEVSYLFWAPPGYESRDSRTRYPVAYFLHGGGGGYANIPEAFLPQAAAAIVAGTLPPFLGIVVNGLPSSFYVDSQDGSTPVESIIINDLLPHIDATYPTNGVRLVEGFSMGGRGCTYFGFKYPEKFHGVADFAGAIHDWGFFEQMSVVARLFPDQQAFDDAWIFNLAKRNADAIRAQLAAGVLIVVGDRDTNRGNTYEWNKKLHATLDELHIPNQLLVVPGVRHSYQLLAADENVARRHLAYYAAVFGQRASDD